MMSLLLTYELQLIETLIAIALYFTFKFLAHKAIDKAGVRFEYNKPRVKIIKKSINVILFLVATSFVLFVWGVEQEELFFFISSLLTVLGIAFFAQWSIISNITSTLIIFFNHPIKIGDTIQILDKEYDVEGRVSDIGVFFMIIKTDDDEQVAIPSNLFMQKMVKKKKSRPSH